jgi:hypothetical protein
VNSEEAVWECVLRWVNHNPEKRKGNIVELMKKVKLGLLGTVLPRRYNGSPLSGGK